MATVSPEYRSGRVLIDRASKTTVLTSSETNALNTTAQTVVPAPPAGQALVPEQVIFSKRAGVVGAAGGNTTMRFDGQSAITTNLTRANLFTAGARTYMENLDGSDRLFPATALEIHMASADMTGNNRPLEVTVIYSVVEVA